MKCGDCKRLINPDGRVGWCTARGRYRYLIEETMGCPYFEEREMEKMCSFNLKCSTLKPLDIPGEWEPHPDTKRLDWLLGYISFEKIEGYGYVYLNEPSGRKLEKAWRQIDSDDPRAIIDKAMEEEI